MGRNFLLLVVLLLLLRTIMVRRLWLVRLVGLKRVSTMHARDGLPRRCLVNGESIVGHGGWSLHASHAGPKAVESLREERSFQRLLLSRGDRAQALAALASRKRLQRVALIENGKKRRVGSKGTRVCLVAR